VLGLTLFNYCLRFFKWHYFIRQIGITQLSWLESARLFIAGFPLAVTPGKIGEALKGLWLNQVSDVTVARGIAVVLAERISDGLAVLFLSTFGVIAYPRYWPAFACILGILAGVVIVSQIRPLAESILRFGEHLPLINRVVRSLYEFYEGSYTLFHPIPTFLSVGLGMISWLGEGIGFYIILLGLGIPPGWHTLSIAIFALSFSIVVGAASTLPGGLGAAEASIAGMLVLLLGVNPDIAATATLLIRMATLWFGVGLGLIVWGFSRDLIMQTERKSTAEIVK
jgi:glycosyltransferase 2 family protein